MGLGSDAGFYFGLGDGSHVAEHDVPFLRVAGTFDAELDATLAGGSISSH